MNVLVTCALVFLFPTLPPCCYRFAEKHIFSFECSCFFFVKQIVFSLKFPDWVEPSFQQVSTTSSGVLLSDQAEVSRPEVRRNWKLTQNISFGRASNRFICYVFSYFNFLIFSLFFQINLVGATSYRTCPKAFHLWFPWGRLPSQTTGQIQSCQLFSAADNWRNINKQGGLCYLCWM